MSSLKNTTTTLRKHLNNKSLYVPWIKLQIGNFVCDTAADKDNLFISIQNVKNSGGLANNTTIVLAYVPSANVGIDNLGDDIDRIDMILGGSREKTIKFQYGYTYPNLKSPEYEMIILSYSVEIQNSVLIYTINAKSSLEKYTNVKASIEGFKEKKPTEVFEIVFNRYLKAEGYTIDWNNVKGTDNIVDEINGANDVNIFEYLKSILEIATYEGDKDDTKDTDRSIYTFSFNNDSKKKQVIVNRLTSKTTNKKSSDRIVFDWMTGKDDIVLNFTTSFNGAVMMTKAYAEEFSQTNLFNLNEEGKANPYYGTLSPTTGPKTDSDYAAERYNWAKYTTYGYKAQLQTLGIPAEYDVLEEVHIIPLIYGKAHHTQGIYQITKITDTIDSSGFSTSWDLIKKDSEEVQEYYKDGYNADAIAKAKESGLYVSNKKAIEKGKQYGNGGSGGGISITASGMRGKVVQIAQSQMEGKTGEVYWNYTMGGGFRNGNATPWCACFVSWCGGQAGAWGGYKSAACIQFKNHFESKGAWQKGKGHGGTYNPQPGDLIIFNWSGIYGGSCNHIGIVESFDGTRVHTLEGNSGDRTRRKSYPVTSNLIVGYCLY